jgi:predicted DNA binding protein
MKGSNLVLTMYHILRGDDKAKQQFVKDASRDERVKKLELKKDFMVSVAVEKRNRMLDLFYNPKLIFIKPAVNYPDGSETWEVASFERSDLVRLWDVCKRKYDGRLLHLKKIKMPKIFIPQIMPGLTEKQEKAFKLASEEGYYEFPRKTNLHKLAKIAKVSRPTYEEHLRKAEIKILKFMRELVLG